MLIYMLAFRDGLYPDASVRAETALILHRLSTNHTAARLTGALTADGVATTARDAGSAGWPYLVLHIANIAAPGGLLEHSWSLAITMQWYLWTPLIPHAVLACRWLWRQAQCTLQSTCRHCSSEPEPPRGVAGHDDADGHWHWQPERHSQKQADAAGIECKRNGPGADNGTPVQCKSPGALRLELNARIMLWVCAVGVVVCTVSRVVAHRHIIQFSGLFALFAHFFWYSHTLPRLTPMFIGAAAGVFCVADDPWAAAWRAWITTGRPPNAALAAGDKAARADASGAAKAEAEGGATTPRVGEADDEENTWLFRRNLVAGLLGANVAVCALANMFWRDAMGKDDEASGALHHTLMYVLYRPGGALCGAAYAWVVFTLMYGPRWTPLTQAQSRRLRASRASRSAPALSVTGITGGGAESGNLKASDACGTGNDLLASVSTALTSGLARAGSVGDAAAGPRLRRRKGTDTRSTAYAGIGDDNTRAVAEARFEPQTPPASAPKSVDEARPVTRLPAPAAAPLWRRFVTALVPITFSVYLVNSVVYQQMYGWPQRLHPCPSLLPRAALEAADSLYARRTPLFAPALDTASQAPHAEGTAPPPLAMPRWQRTVDDVIGGVEGAATRMLTSIATALRGPADLYCAPNATTGSIECAGLCFSNEVVRVDGLQDAACLATRNCTASPYNRYERRLHVPTKAWLQYLHYGSICIGVSWVMAAALYYLVELPLGLLLTARPVRAVLQYPVACYALVCMIVSIPAHVMSDRVMLKHVNRQLEDAVMHTHFA